MAPQGWTIGYIGGIAIKVNISLVFMALLVTFTLATGLLPVAVSGASPVLYWLTGLLASVIFFGSVLFHELAHSVMALHYHIPVAQIVLYIFGGVANIVRDPERPVQEFVIAIAGPISSMFLAVGFGLLGRLPGIVGVTCNWLAVINLSLALFNLLPGFPLDGGRVLRSALWKFNGSYRRATRQASRVGQIMAGLFVVLGLLLSRGSLFSGIWYFAIALFLYSAASASYRQAAGPVLAKDTSIRKVMRSGVPVIEPGTPLAILAWRYLDHARDQAFPVMLNGDLVGMVTAIEVDRVPRLEWGKVRVEDVMIPRSNLCVLSIDDSIETAMAALEQVGAEHAPIFEAGQLAGMLNRRDIVYRT